MIHRENSRVLVLHLLWQSRGARSTAAKNCLLTTPSLLSRATRLLLRLARIIGRIEVDDAPGADGVHLDHAAFLAPGEVIRLWRHEGKRPCRQFVSLGCIEFVAHAKVESARDNSGVLDVRMPVRRNFVSGWPREPYRERALLRGITLENGQLRARGQRRGAVFPLDGCRGEDAMVGRCTLL